MDSSLYLIQGVFFEEREWLDVGYTPFDGAVAIVRTGLGRYLFSGVIVRDDKTSSDTYQGHLLDVIGEAALFDICLIEEKFSFTKKYLHREDIIRYEFTRQPNGIWIGKYDGSLTRSGFSRCMLTPVSAELFAPPPPDETATPNANGKPPG